MDKIPIFKKAFVFILSWLFLLIFADRYGPWSVFSTTASASTSISEGIATSNQNPICVAIEQQDNTFQLIRGGEPYFIKGIGGRGYLEHAAAAGANSVRTWGAYDAGPFLDRAESLNMTVTMGIWLSHHAEDYEDPVYKQKTTEEVLQLVTRHKNHPALLFWALGNEINLSGADTESAWRFVNELALLIKSLDENHPVISVITCSRKALENIAAFAPDLDAVGMNAYGALTGLRSIMDKSSYQGPYIVTEWGVIGYWEAEKTTWGRPIEPTSSWKSDFQLSRYNEDILANSDKCIGSYVFVWGQKQERTPTWFSMIFKDLPISSERHLTSPAVDAMHFNWTGQWPANRAPEIMDMMINESPAESNITLLPGGIIESSVQASDPENDQLTYAWELMQEPSMLSVGGAHESKPISLTRIDQDNSPVLRLEAPIAAGEYRLFVYVLDQQGHVATANIPFQIEASAKPETLAVSALVGPS